jgi:hypothetical protein
VNSAAKKKILGSICHLTKVARQNIATATIKISVAVKGKEPISLETISVQFFMLVMSN